MYNDNSIEIAAHNPNIRKEKRPLWTPTEYRYLYDKFHGTDTAGDIFLFKKWKSQTNKTEVNKENDIDPANTCSELDEEVYDKSRNNDLNKNQRVSDTSMMPDNKTDRKKLPEIFLTRLNKDEKLTADEAKHRMEKWWVPELLSTNAELAMFTEDEEWLIDDHNNIIEESRENGVSNRQISDAQRAVMLDHNYAFDKAKGTCNVLDEHTYQMVTSSILPEEHPMVDHVKILNYEGMDSEITEESQENLLNNLMPYRKYKINRVSNCQISDAKRAVMLDHNYANDYASDKAKGTCNVLDEHSYHMDTSSIPSEEHPMVDHVKIVNNDGMDSESSVSAVSEGEINVVTIEKPKKLMGMVAYEKHIEDFMSMDIEEMQKLMFLKMNEDEDIRKMLLQVSIKKKELLK